MMGQHNVCLWGRAEEEADFKEYAARPDVFEDISARIAPQIFGHKEIKQAVACLLFGGSRKVGPAAVLIAKPQDPAYSAIWVLTGRHA